MEFCLQKMRVVRAFSNWLNRRIRQAAAGGRLLWLCGALSLGGTMTAAYPVTAIVTPAALLSPLRWRQISLISAVGSAFGATMLVLIFHHLGWQQLFEHYPQFSANPAWHRVMGLAMQDGIPALFLIAISPLPQTPALIFFGIAEQNYIGVFAAMLAGKVLKYGLFAWLAAHFPERFKGVFGNNHPA